MLYLTCVHLGLMRGMRIWFAQLTMCRHASAMLGPAAAIIALGATTLLAPQSASALDFSFSFGNVTGVITGLKDNTPDQHCSDEYPVEYIGKTPCVVSVTSSSGAGTYTAQFGTFTVIGGSLTESDWRGTSNKDGSGLRMGFIGRTDGKVVAWLEDPKDRSNENILWKDKAAKCDLSGKVCTVTFTPLGTR